MKILAIDYGSVRVGIAGCDESETLAFPLKTIKNSSESELIQNIYSLVENFKAKMLILGHPLNMDGSEGEKAKTCQTLALKLKSVLKIPIVLWDERQTTKQALNYLIESKTKKKKKKKIVDELAATIILDSFLKYKSNNLKINFI